MVDGSGAVAGRNDLAGPDRLTKAALVPVLFAALLTPALAHSPIGESPPPRGFAVRPGATLETGDTFVQDGVRYRLWGVQACLPGTRAQLTGGRIEDCGAVSLAGLAALLRDGTASCIEIARSTWRGDPYAFVSCTVRIDGGEVELGTALIASGFAFAALGPDGRPVHPPYAAAETVARESWEGLWAAQAFDHPAETLPSGAAAR